MSDVVIRAEDISKLYRLGEVGTGTITHDLNRWWHRVRGKEDPYQKVGQRNDRAAKADSEYVWALKDINFEVKRGEVLGIVGRNGAGKSTLLKILSRVTAPTSGQIKVKGRIASLLEVGTGFNPELTGRDNIYLNGAILGMRKQEIARKFDEIVAFSEVERYIDTPVKRYSSGMYVRLAFAVAAHLEPEILIVDEVLAVGDAAFQKKCLGKMQDVAGQGRTILFVSHNMTVITRLCSRGVLLEEGAIRLSADTAAVVSIYLQGGGGDKAEFVAAANKPIGNDIVKLLSVSVKDQEGGTGPNFGAELPLQVEIRYQVLKATRNLRVGFRLLSSEGIVVFTSTDTDNFTEEQAVAQREPGVFFSRCQIPPCFLNRGQYILSVGSDIAMVQGNFFCENVVSFVVEPVGGQLASKYDNRLGFVCPELQWEIQP